MNSAEAMQKAEAPYWPPTAGHPMPRRRRLELKQEEKFYKKTLWSLIVNFAWRWFDTLPQNTWEAILKAMLKKKSNWQAQKLMSNINIIILSEIQEIHLLHAYISYILLHNKVHQMVVITKGQTSDFAHSNKGTSLVNMSSMSRLMHQVVSIIESKLKTLTKWHPYVSITPLSENEKNN
jgi:hypothetical protein